MRKKLVFGCLGVVALFLAGFLFLGASFFATSKQVLRLTVVINKPSINGMDDAITDDVKHLIAQQVSPIVVIGNMFKSIVLGYNRCKSGIWKSSYSKRQVNLKKLIEQTEQLRACPVNSKRELKVLYDIGKEVAKNLLEDEKALFRDESASYFTLRKVGAQNNFEEFDRNWIVFEVKGKCVHILIPRRYLEHVFGVDMGKSTAPCLDAVISDLCKKHMLIDGSGRTCNSLTDVLRAIGLDLSGDSACVFRRVYFNNYYDEHGKMVSGISKRIGTRNLYVSKKALKEKMYAVVSKVLEKLMCSARQNQAWCIRFHGHGNSSYADIRGDKIVGLSLNDFSSLILNIIGPKGIGLMSISSCYAGSKAHKTKLKSVVQSLKNQDRNMVLILEAATDSPTANPVPAILSEKEINYLFANTSYLSHVGDFVLWNALPFYSLPRVDEFFGVVETALKITANSEDLLLKSLAPACSSFLLRPISGKKKHYNPRIPSNIPQLLNLCFSSNYVPLVDDNKILVVTKGQGQSNDTIQICDKNVLLITTKTVKCPLKISGFVPNLISLRQEHVHSFDVIDAKQCSSDLTLKTFLKRFCVHDDVCCATDRGFYIKELRLPHKTYTNIYVQQTNELTAMFRAKNCNKGVVWAYKFNDERGWEHCSKRSLTSFREDLERCRSIAEQYVCTQTCNNT